MASYIYASPKNFNESDERVVIASKSSSVPQRGGRYIGGSMPPLVNVTAKIKRASR